jgi:hypothetical protein
MYNFNNDKKTIIRISKIDEFNREIASKKDFKLYYFDTKEHGENCFVAYIYRNDKEEKNLRAVVGDTKHEAINLLLNS